MIKLGTCTKIATNRKQKVQFSLPRVLTCPGMTKACALYCYCKRGNHIFTTVRALRRHNWSVVKHYRLKNDSEGLAAELVQAIKDQNNTTTMRWFEEGDLDSQFTADAIALAITKLPEYHHMIITKSIMLDLDKLANIKHACLLLSSDDYNYAAVTAKAEQLRSKGYRCKIAYSAIPIDQKLPNNTLPCPATGNGKLHSIAGACQLCRHCFTQKSKKDVAFYKH